MQPRFEIETGWRPSVIRGPSAVEDVLRIARAKLSVVVGNDIVDLRDPRLSGKAGDVRFLKRVCRPQEMSRILSSRDADLSLWIHWAAKEAAFKVASKSLGAPPVFRHRSFRVCFDDGSMSSGTIDSPLNGTVEYEHLRIAFHGAMSKERVHVVAYSVDGSGASSHAQPVQSGEAGVGHGPDLMETGVQPFDLMLEERFTPRELASVHSHSSAYVRLLARTAMAEALGVDEERLEVVCGPQPSGRVPPTVYLDGRRAPIDVTLSHHGQLVGWAFALQPTSGT